MGPEGHEDEMMFRVGDLARHPARPALSFRSPASAQRFSTAICSECHPIGAAYMPGTWNLSEPRDLYAKFRSDMERFREAPFDSYIAFDVFMTGYHIVDWLYPHDKAQRELTVSASPWL